MFLHILVNLYMILYRFFVLLYNTILDNKIHNLINAHEVQTVSWKKWWWERKTMSKNMEIWLLHVGSTWTTMLHANKWLSWRTEMSFMNLSIGNQRNFLLFFSYYYIHHHNVRALSPLVVVGACGHERTPHGHWYYFDTLYCKFLILCEYLISWFSRYPSNCENFKTRMPILIIVLCSLHMSKK